MLPKAVIVDVDGTLVDVAPIRFLVEGSKRDFEGFHKASIDCKPNFHILNRIRFHADNGIKIILVSGRQEKFRKLTDFWLALWDAPCDELMMRQNQNNAKDVVLKSEFLLLLRERFDVIEAIDDRDDLIELWRMNGIKSVIDARRNKSRIGEQVV